MRDFSDDRAVVLGEYIIDTGDFNVNFKKDSSRNPLPCVMRGVACRLR